MYSKELLQLTCWAMLLGGLHLTTTTTTTTFVSAMTIANQDLERYFRTANNTHTFATMAEDRIAMDVYTYAFLNYSYFDGSDYHWINFNEEKARYGEGRMFSVRGKLVHISSENDRTDDYACTRNIRGTLGNRFPERGITWIALVRRGKCTFEEKVKNVHAEGASGVIVFNDKPVMNLEKMQIRDKSRNITAVITFQDIGLAMASILDSGHDVTAEIIEGSSGMRPINAMNRTSVLFVSVSFIVLMIISLVWLIFYYIQRFRYLQAKDQQSRNLCSVTKKAIMKIPTKTGKSSDEKDADGDCCAICIECYKSSDIIRILPCKHEFHKNCIDPWLIEHRTCPMCKLDVLKFYGYVFLGSEESIVEIEVERPTTTPGTAAATNSSQIQPIAATTTHQRTLGELVRSRDFVIDFPRIFVLEGGSTTGTHESLFPARLPERSQSTLSLAYAKDWMNAVTNKLDEQQGLRRIRKTSRQQDMLQENLLLGVQRGSELFRKRRSRSADGGYSNGYAARLEQRQKQKEQKQIEDSAAASGDTCIEIEIEGQSTPPATAASSSLSSQRRNSAALRQLTDAAYGQSRHRQREEYNYLTMARQRLRTVRRGSDISLSLLQRDIERGDMHELQQQRQQQRNDVQPSPNDITIQINGEGIELE